MSRSTDHVPELGETVAGWQEPPVPSGEVLQGRYAMLTPLDADEHAELLYSSYRGHDQVWDYLPYGPFPSASQYRQWMEQITATPGLVFYAIRNLESAEWQGVASYLRITPEHGSIEVGHINYSPRLQGTRAATEAMYLMMRWAFEAGYRRYEWKCDALNRPSRRAAQRLGLSFEGVFRQAAIVKGRNRDTAWFAAIDRDWPALKEAYEQWLAPQNFIDGVQRKSLGYFTGSIRVADDPSL